MYFEIQSICSGQPVGSTGYQSANLKPYKVKDTCNHIVLVFPLKSSLVYCIQQHCMQLGENGFSIHSLDMYQDSYCTYVRMYVRIYVATYVYAHTYI